MNTRCVKRGDIYYADLGSIGYAVGHELAKRRPVLIVQNNLGNKSSSTTICLCLTTNCRPNIPYHVNINNLNIVAKESDVCAEQIRTIDQSRLDTYLGNVGSAIMEQVDKALAISLGLSSIGTSNAEPASNDEIKALCDETTDTFNYMNEQLEFWKNIKLRASVLQSEITRLDEEINSIMNYIEDKNLNAVQGYKVYKALRDKQIERKSLIKDIICLESINESIDTEKVYEAMQKSVTLASDNIKDANRVINIEKLIPDLNKIVKNSPTL